MKKQKTKNLKIILGSLGAAAILTPVVAVSAVACSSQSSTTLPVITIKTQPENQKATIHQTSNMPVFSVGAITDNENAKLTYQWYSNTTESTEGATAIAGATSSSYTVTDKDVKTAGKIYFFVQIKGTFESSQLTTVTSSIATLTIASTPAIAISSQPQEQSVVIGQKENLPQFAVAASSGDPNEHLTYQWFRAPDNAAEGTMIPGETGSTYNVKQDDVKTTSGEEFFYVRVNGMINGAVLPPATSERVKLNTNIVPIIIVNKDIDKNVIVNQPENIPTFTVNASTSHADEKLTYQWYITASDNTDETNPINNATSKSYTPSPIDISATGTKKYFVKVSGWINGVELVSVNSDVMTLTIENAPEITINTNPVDETVILGQTEGLPTLTVSVNNIENAHLTYQWYSNTTKSETGAQAIEGAINPTYKLQASNVGTASNEMKYFFVKINGSLNGVPLKEVISNIATLTTVLPITINDQPVNHMVTVGQTLNLPELSVNASTGDSTNVLTYQWYSNVVPSTSGAVEIAGQTAKTYNITSEDAATTGTKYFFVKVSGTIGGVALVPVYSDIATLTINVTPSIIISSQSENSSVIVGQTTSLPELSVTASSGVAGESLTYQWYKSASGSLEEGTTAIAGATEKTYTLTADDVKAVGEQHFFVKVSGTVNGAPLNHADSKIITVLVSAAPVITFQNTLANATATLNQADNLPLFTIEVTPIQNAVWSFQWYSNTTDSTSGGTEIVGATGNSYQVKADDLTAVGLKYFYVEVSATINGAPLGPVLSNIATLTITSA